MECLVKKLEHIQHILFFEFTRGAKAAEAARNICSMYVDNVIRESMTRKWCFHFKDDRFDISDTPHSGRLSGFHEYHLNTLINNDSCQWTWELTNELWQFHHRATFAFNGQGLKIGCMVPRALSQSHKNQRVAIRASLLALHWLAREHHRSFLSLSLLMTKNGVVMLI